MRTIMPFTGSYAPISFVMMRSGLTSTPSDICSIQLFFLLYPIVPLSVTAVNLHINVALGSVDDCLVVFAPGNAGDIKCDRMTAICEPLE